MNQNQILTIFLLLWYLVSAQQKGYKIPDSLKNKSYDYLDDKAYELKKDTPRATVYLYAYLQKAKKEQNWKQIANGYGNLSNQSSDKLSLIYADSTIYAAKKTKNNTLVGSAYLSKGIAYYSLKHHNYALDNYILASNYLAKTTDKYLAHKLKYHIALVKYYLGYYDETITLLRECVSYFKNDNPQPYLNSLHFLGVCYNKIGEYGLCAETNILGLSQCKKLNVLQMQVYFIHSQGINDFFKQNYASAINNIESSIEGLKEKNDFANESVAYFYIGKSYWKIQKYEVAISYFEKVDKLFNTRGYLRPDLREVYEMFIDYYKTKDNPKLQLYYVNQLLKADRLLNDTFKYLIGKINKEYNTQELLIEKENLKQELFIKNHKYSVLIGFTSILFSGFLFVTYRNLRNQKIYKKRFEELIQQLNNSKDKSKNKENNEKPAISGINTETVSIILKQLEKFESEKKYLDRDWKLSSLATSFNYSPSYLSSIIHYYKEKKFNEYINDLKIEYIISILHTNRLLRNYTNKALAEEVGFSSTERFSKAFRAKTGISPAYFINQLKKESTNTNS